jgi:hypothetical protein
MRMNMENDSSRDHRWPIGLSCGMLAKVFVVMMQMVTLAGAQEEEAATTEEVKGRKAWFVHTSMPEGMENPVPLMTGNDISELMLSKRSPSAPVKIPGDGILKLVRKVDPPPVDGKPAYLTVAQVMVPEGVKQALVILSPAEKNPQGLLWETKVMDLALFKGGSWLFLNTTPLKVGVDMGGNKMEIASGESMVYGDGLKTEPVNMTIRYFFHHPKKSEWKIISASTVAIYPNRREICIFSWDKRFQRIDYHGITLSVL